jgi:hypothetical protein
MKKNWVLISTEINTNSETLLTITTNFEKKYFDLKLINKTTKEYKILFILA